MSAPFGITLYSPIETLSVTLDLGHGNYIVEAPRPHPMFETYVALATPALGVVWVKAIGAEIQNDNFGTEICTQVDRLAEQLTQRYGPAEKSDFLMEGSIWTEPEHWSQGVVAGERFYSSKWMRPRAQQLPDDLESIWAGAVDRDSYSTAVAVEYASRKLGQAKAEIERQLADLL
jgi:hypothetical protein